MNEDDIHPFCAELNGFLSERMNYKKAHCRVWHNKINARTSKFSLTLSWEMIGNSIEITAISFLETRNGHCTALLAFLKDKAKKYGYEEIKFISVTTDAMKSFVMKYGFVNHPMKDWFTGADTASKNWSKWISDFASLIS